MNKTKTLLISFIFLSMVCGVLTYIVSAPKPDSVKSIAAFSKLTGLTDLAVYLENPAVRYRTVSNISDLLSSDPFAMDTSFSAIIYQQQEK